MDFSAASQGTMSRLQSDLATGPLQHHRAYAMPRGNAKLLVIRAFLRPIQRNRHGGLFRRSTVMEIDDDLSHVSSPTRASDTFEH